MTLITVYRHKPISKGDTDGIICLSDSLISEINNPQKRYTQNSIKVLSLSFAYHFESASYPKLIKNEIGLAYAGNTSIALQTFNTIRIFCQNIAPSKTTKYFTPSIVSIANMIQYVLNNYYLSYGEQIETMANTDFLIFGFCFKEQKFKLFHISAQIVDNNATTTVKDINIDELNHYSIGTGEKEFNKFYKNSANKNILYCFKDFIKTDSAKNKATGGYIIKALASIGYFRYYAEINDNNYDLLQINSSQIGGFSFIPFVSEDYIVSMTMNPFLS